MKKLRNTAQAKLTPTTRYDGWVPIAFIAIILAVWQMIVDVGLVERFILPSPSDIGRALIATLPQIIPHSLVTLREAAIGFAVAIVLSFILAIAMDSLTLLYRAVYPILVISQTVPIIALAPLFVIWFGFGLLPKVIVVVLVCFFPIVISLLDGLKSVDEDYMNLMTSMGASRLTTFRLLKFPAAMINFFSGLRIAATYSIMGAVIGEWLGGKAGLGVYMLRVKHSYSLDKMFAVILVIVILSMTVFKAIDIIEKIMMPWRRQGDRLEN